MDPSGNIPPVNVHTYKHSFAMKLTNSSWSWRYHSRLHESKHALGFLHWPSGPIKQWKWGSNVLPETAEYISLYVKGVFICLKCSLTLASYSRMLVPSKHNSWCDWGDLHFWWQQHKGDYKLPQRSCVSSLVCPQGDLLSPWPSLLWTAIRELRHHSWWQTGTICRFPRELECEIR